MRALSIAGLLLLAGCIDFKDGLSCTHDEDCLGYLCVQGQCRTSSETTDPKADAGTSDEEVTPVTLAANQSYPSQIHVDGQAVFWRTHVNNSVYLNRVGKAGGSPTSTELIDGPLEAGRDLAWDDAATYFAQPDRIMSLRKAGGAPSVLATLQQAQDDGIYVGSFAGVVAADDTNLYWFADEPSGGKGRILKVAKTGGAVTALTRIDPPNSLAAANGIVYWGTPTGIQAVAVSGGTATPVIQGALVERLWTDGSVLVGIWNKTSFVVAPLGGSTASTLDVADEIGPYASDGRVLVWVGTGSRGDGIFKMASSGGSISRVILQEDARLIGSVAVDGESVYWTKGGSGGAGMVVKVAK